MRQGGLRTAAALLLLPAVSSAASAGHGGQQGQYNQVVDHDPSWEYNPHKAAYSYMAPNGRGPKGWSSIKVKPIQCSEQRSRVGSDGHTIEYYEYQLTGNAAADSETGCQPIYPYAGCDGDSQSPINIVTDEVDRMSTSQGIFLSTWSPEQLDTATISTTTTTASTATGTTATAGTAAEQEAHAQCETDSTWKNARKVKSERVINTNGAIRVRLEFRRVHLTSPLFPEDLLLKEIIYHSPAEHLIDGVRHDVERVMVFKPADSCWSGAKSVNEWEVRISTLYRNSSIGQMGSMSESPTEHDNQQLRPLGSMFTKPQNADSDKVLAELQGHLEQLRGEGDTLLVFDFHPPVDYMDHEMFYYEGSQTEPPCYEKVRWLVSSKVRDLPTEHVAKLREATLKTLKGATTGESWPLRNARPLQATSNRYVRGVRFYGQTKNYFWGELERVQRKQQEDSALARDIQADDQFNGTLILNKLAEEDQTKITQDTLRDILVALAITLTLLICGLALLVLVRQGIIAPYMLPPWLGGTAEPEREKWVNSVTKRDEFGCDSEVKDGEDIEELEEMEEEEDEEGDSATQ